MSHRNSCPPRWRAETQGERDQSSGKPVWENPYARKPFEHDHCRTAERAWEDGHRMAQAREEEERRAERSRREATEQRRQREDQWARDQREREMADRALLDEESEEGSP